jgi:curli biogenesis system outer membrane secretion channel CsgG
MHVPLLRHRYPWIGEALSELLTADLSDSQDLAVVDRKKLSEYYKEMKLSRAGLVTKESTSECGRHCKVRQIINNLAVLYRIKTPRRSGKRK